MLLPTLKPRSVRNGGTPVDPSAVPNSSGEKQDDNNTIYGPANGESFVTVRGGDDGPSLEELVAANDLVDKYVAFFTNGKGQEFEKPEHLKAIRQSLVWLIANPECNQAFKDANLPLPGDVIKKRGLTLAGAGVLLDPSVDSALGINETIRQAAVKHTENLATQAFTIDVNGGRLYTVFKNSAFSGSSWMWGTYALEEIVVHENIHVAGQPGDDKASGHDLSTFKYYSSIVSKCRIDK